MLTLITVCTVSVHVCMMCVCECYIYIYIYLFSVRAGERDGDRERRGVRCKLKATTACSPDEGVGTMLLFQGRVVSDCDPHPHLPLTPLPPPLSSSLSLSLSPRPCLLPPISSPQREKRWSISSAGGEKNSSSVSRGGFWQRERDEMGLEGKEGTESGGDGEREGVDTQ